jgi:chemotaxis protein histidine kinase CheA
MSFPTKTSTNATQAIENGHENDALTASTLQSIWEHQQDRASVRIDLIERAIGALANNNLDVDLRHEAERAAHTLAGSVGMFGFMQASEAAHRLERELGHPTRNHVANLSALLLTLRNGVKGPVILRSIS